MVRFTRERRDRVVELVAGGATISEAAAAAGISRRTVMDWQARGRANPGTAAGEFAAALAAARAGDADVPAEGPLSEDDVVRLLEAQARRGNVAAMRLLLARAKLARADATAAARARAGRDAAPDALRAVDDLARARARRGPGDEAS